MTSVVQHPYQAVMGREGHGSYCLLFLHVVSGALRREHVAGRSLRTHLGEVGSMRGGIKSSSYAITRLPLFVWYNSVSTSRMIHGAVLNGGDSFLLLR